MSVYYLMHKKEVCIITSHIIKKINAKFQVCLISLTGWRLAFSCSRIIQLQVQERKSENCHNIFIQVIEPVFNACVSKKIIMNEI